MFTWKKLCTLSVQEGAQLISEAFDVVEKESGNYKGTQAIKISRGPVYKVRDGLNLITANADEQFVPVNTGDDVTWVDFVADKILDACNMWVPVCWYRMSSLSPIMQRIEMKAIVSCSWFFWCSSELKLIALTSTIEFYTPIWPFIENYSPKQLLSTDFTRAGVYKHNRVTDSDEFLEVAESKQVRANF